MPLVGKLGSMITHQGNSLSVTYPPDEQGNTHQYVLQYSPFRLTYKVDDKTLLRVNEHDTLRFEKFTNFSAPNNTLKSADVEADCFYNLLLRMEQGELNQNFGWSFMEDDRWLENYVSWV